MQDKSRKRTTKLAHVQTRSWGLTESNYSNKHDYGSDAVTMQIVNWQIDVNLPYTLAYDSKRARFNAETKQTTGLHSNAITSSTLHELLHNQSLLYNRLRKRTRRTADSWPVRDSI